jgi:hypothetical protein
MSGFHISLDRNAEIKIEARIKITTDPTAAAGPAVKVSASCGGITSTHTGATAMSYTLPADKQVRLQIEYVDKNGNPAEVDDEVQWSSSDDVIAKVEPLTVQPSGNVPEGGVVMLIPGTAVGNCQITAKADADLGDGVRELISLFDVTVVAGEAVAGVITPVGEQTPVP